MTFSRPALTSAAAMLLVLSLAWFGHVRPVGLKREKLLAEIAQRQAMTADLRRCAQVPRDDDAKIASLKTALAEFDSRLSPAADMNKVLEELWRIAESNSLQTRSIKTLSERRTGRFVEQELQMELSGDFSGFYQFMLNFENMKRIVRINRMDLAKTNDGDGQMRASMTLSIFFQPDNGPAADDCRVGPASAGTVADGR